MVPGVIFDTVQPDEKLVSDDCGEHGIRPIVTGAPQIQRYMPGVIIYCKEYLW